MSIEAGMIAKTVLAALDEGRRLAPFTQTAPQFDVAAAAEVTAELRRLRVARGERPAGRKIGFTNRAIWPEYGVYEPIWGDVYDTTLHDVRPGATIRVGHLPEPRIEPEIVFGIGRDIAADAGLHEIVASLGWVAHGFEIVQSIFPDWRFKAADCVAGGGLHGALFVGPRRMLDDDDRQRLAGGLSGLTIRLSRDGALMDEGTGANVLDGPVQALGHLVRILAADPFNPPLREGEVVTTGTLTRAFPVCPGECWSTEIGNFDLSGLCVEIG